VSVTPAFDLYGPQEPAGGAGDLLAALEGFVRAIVREELEALRPAEEDGWLRGAEKIAAYLDAPVSRIYALSASGRLPCLREGRSLIARRSDLDRWLAEGGARRP